MAEIIKFIKNKLRLLVQLLFSLLTNGHWSGFFSGQIYQGDGKRCCVPGLNCYSCPGALGACPLGSLQAVLSDARYKLSFYVSGFFLVIGAALGRFVCGWLCPFGLVQELLHKIPAPKISRLPGEKWWRMLKYVFLLLFVIGLPLLLVDGFGYGEAWFCKYICPSGTLSGGIPMLALNAPLRDAAGPLFAWKAVVLLVIVLASLFIFRPFCRYFCPLGAIYGLFNPISLYRFKIDRDKCVSCGACQQNCRMGIDVLKTPNTPECIRCGDCLRSCQHQALYREKLFTKK